MYGYTPCDIGQRFGFAADICCMFTYLCTRQGSLSIFTIFGVTLDVEIFHCPQGCLKESNLFLRFKTGAITRQGVWPSSQYWIALIHLAHCNYFGIWNGVFVLLFLAVVWMDHCCEFKTVWDVYILSFKPKNRVASWI